MIQTWGNPCRTFASRNLMDNPQKARNLWSTSNKKAKEDPMPQDAPATHGTRTWHCRGQSNPVSSNRFAPDPLVRARACLSPQGLLLDYSHFRFFLSLPSTVPILHHHSCTVCFRLSHLSPYIPFGFWILPDSSLPIRQSLWQRAFFGLGSRRSVT